MSTVTGVVLAAGASERMGRPKLLLPFRGTTILGSTLDAVAASLLDRVVVVGGPGGGVRKAMRDRTDVIVVENAQPHRGNMSSLLAATESDPGAGAFVLVAGDLPTLGAASIDALVHRWNTDQPWAAITEYRDRIAHPFLLSRECVDEIRGFAGPKVLWRVLVDSRDDRVVHVTSEVDAPLDVNTPSDYEALNRLR